MKIIFCFYDNVNYEARGAEELQCLLSLGEVSFVSFERGESKAFSNAKQFITRKRNYLSFISLAKQVIKKTQADIVFLHDNYCACLIPFIKSKSPNSMVVYDMSELYIGSYKGKHKILEKWLLRDKEFKYLKETDLVISASIERAYISKGFFGLKELPVVFDNMHEIKEKYDFDKCFKKFVGVFENKAFTCFYCGGLLDGGERDIVKIIDTFTELGEGYKLIIAGSTLDESKVKYSLEANLKTVKNVFYVGKLTRGELKFFYDYTDFSLVSFKLTDVNTIYCASGKLFESVFSKKPLVLSNNPPHIRLIEKYQIGTIAYEDNYLKAIEDLQKDYMRYANNVSAFCDSLDCDNRIKNLGNRILYFYEENSKRKKE